MRLWLSSTRKLEKLLAEERCICGSNYEALFFMVAQRLAAIGALRPKNLQMNPIDTVINATSHDNVIV